MLHVNKQSGFSLIEVLVAMVILLVGILGVGAMQGTALKRSTEADIRTAALIASADLTERVRVRLGGCTAFTCSVSAAANSELATWQADLQSLLPMATGAVSVDGTSMTITISWPEMEGGKQVTKSFIQEAQIL